MNEYPKRYELRLRNEEKNNKRNHSRMYSPVDKVDKSKTGSGSFSFRTGFCTVLLLFVVFLKLSGGEGSEDILLKMDRLINSQFDMQKTAEVMSEFVYDASNYFSGNNKEIVLSEPVKGGKIKEGFVETVHPVFMTDVAPTGITFSASPSSYVFNSISGRVSSVSENSDGTKRVVVKYDKNTSIAYDNLANVYVKEDDLVPQGQVIAILKEEDPALLKFEMWVDNAAVDPAEYLPGNEMADAEK